MAFSLHAAEMVFFIFIAIARCPNLGTNFRRAEKSFGHHFWPRKCLNPVITEHVDPRHTLLKRNSGETTQSSQEV